MEKLKANWPKMFIGSIIVFYLVIRIIEGFNILEMTPKVQVSIRGIMGLVFFIASIIEFDKNNKIVSVLGISIMLFIMVNYLKTSIQILNINYPEGNYQISALSQESRKLWLLYLIYIIMNSIKSIRNISDSDRNKRNYNNNEVRSD